MGNTRNMRRKDIKFDFIDGGLRHPKTLIWTRPAGHWKFQSEVQKRSELGAF